jgi:hypothetical protein
MRSLSGYLPRCLTFSVDGNILFMKSYSTSVSSAGPTAPEKSGAVSVFSRLKNPGGGNIFRITRERVSELSNDLINTESFPS